MTKVVLGIILIVNCVLIHQYLILVKDQSKWWAAIVLNDIVLYFLIFGQMLQEKFGWSRKLLKWRQELYFEKVFKTEKDQSETNI